MAKTYTPAEVAIKVLQKSEELLKAAMPGLTTAKIMPVPGVISPSNQNTANPTKAGSQAVVKTAKVKKPGRATDKPSVFFGKNEDQIGREKTSIENLKDFLENRKTKKKI